VATASHRAWKGVLSFGLVNIPVGLAVSSDGGGVGFRQLHRECGTPINQIKHCGVCEKDLAADEVVRGYEYQKGNFVFVEDSDLDAVAPERESTIEIERFVPVDSVDPLICEKTYYLFPGDSKAERKSYATFTEALRNTGKAAIARFVRSGKENLAFIRQREGILYLDTVCYAEYVRSTAAIKDAVEGVATIPAEVEVAGQLITQLSGDFNHAEFEDKQTARVRGMVEQLLSGEHPMPRQAPEQTETADLMAALKQSVAETQKKKAVSRKKVTS
jgi:DNA end-binding protein Ku